MAVDLGMGSRPRAKENAIDVVNSGYGGTQTDTGTLTDEIDLLQSVNSVESVNKVRVCTAVNHEELTMPSLKETPPRACRLPQVKPVREAKMPPEANPWSQQKEGHYTELDGMRGVLACMVMLHHLGLNTVLARCTSSRIERGEWGLCVDFFFLLSGFVLCRSFCAREPGVGEYLVKRLRRLAPLFYVSTLWMLCLSPQFSALELAGNLLLIQSLAGLPSINFPGWSIPFELFLPLLGVLSVSALQRTSQLMAWLLLAAGLLAGTDALILFVQGHNLPPVRAGAGIATGMILYRVRSLASRKMRARRWPLTVMVLFVSAVAIMATAVVWPALAILFYPIAALCVFLGAPTCFLFSTAPLQALGRWSYSIYLLHCPVLATMALLLGTEALAGSVALKGMVVIITVALAAFSFHFVEKSCFSNGNRAA